MKLEVLVTTMHATGFEKFHEMNLQTDAIIVNQADRMAYEETVINGHIVKLITTNTRGLAINRNLALFYASGDLVMFADDDMVFVDDYETLVLKEFQKKSHIDAIRFFSISTNEQRPLELQNATTLKKAKLHRILSGGVWALAAHRHFLLKKHLLFPIHYGAGQSISMGEDSLFMKELLKKSKAFYTSGVLLAHIKQEDSTWFFGYTDVYFENLGYVHAALYGKLAVLSTFRRAYKLHKNQEVQKDFKSIYTLLQKGIKKYYL